MLINPLMWLLTILYFVGRTEWGAAIEQIFPPTVFYFAVTAAVIGNFLYLYMYLIGAVKNRSYQLVKYAYLVPFYWLLMSLAAYKAIFELIYRPHYWHKTEHGLFSLRESLLYAETHSD